MQSQLNHPPYKSAHPHEVSRVMRLTLVGLFSLLWAIWMQPHTVGLRYTLLTFGSLLGACVIFQSINLFKTRFALPIYLLGLLFSWVTYHLLFIGGQYELQLQEYLTIWKRIALSVPFALGLGIALGQAPDAKVGLQDDSVVENSLEWRFFYAGIIAFEIIYLLRVGLTKLAGECQWSLPSFALQLPESSTWHIPKMAVVFFCIPALAIACYRYVCLLRIGKHNSTFGGVYLGVIAATFTAFYLENTKNGMAYSVIIVFIMLLKVLLDKVSGRNLRGFSITITVLVAIFLLVGHHVQKNNDWKTLLVDLNASQNLQLSNAWKDYGAKGYPLNEQGEAVSGGNYLRATWAMVAAGLIFDRPLGYGLVQNSFGHLAKEKWPESKLFHSHSAWLDLALGIGIPGVLLLLFSGILGLKNALQVEPIFWGATGLWLMSGIALLMFTTEVSRSPYIEALFFLVFWVTGIGLNRRK